MTPPNRSPRLSTFVAAAGLCVVAFGSAAAQTCGGYAPFSSGPMRLGGDLALANYGTTFGATGALGAVPAGLHGSLSLFGTRYDHTNATAKGIGVGAGYSVPIGTTSAEWCPVAEIQHTTGPNVGGHHASATAVRLGGAVGTSVAASPTLDVIPFAGLRWIHTSSSFSGAGVRESGSSDGGKLTLGAGLVFSKTMTVRPALDIPVHTSGATVFLISLAFGLGGRR